MEMYAIQYPDGTYLADTWTLTKTQKEDEAAPLPYHVAGSWYDWERETNNVAVEMIRVR